MLSYFRKRMKGESGFTLTELLIVVVIIGILTAIAVPTYFKVQETARERVGQANANMLINGARNAALLQLTGIAKFDDDGKLEIVDAEKLIEWLGLESVDYVKEDATALFLADPRVDAKLP